MDEKEFFARQSNLGMKILQNCRNELYSFFPHLDGAFVGLPAKPDKDLEKIATDGEHLLFSPAFLAEIYGKSPTAVRRGYLHILLHCLYLHLFRENVYSGRQWNLACDMAVEQMIEREALPGLQISLVENPVRERCFQLMGGKGLSAEQIYNMLGHSRFPYSLEELEEAFSFDDHSLWGAQKDPVKMAQTRKKWEKVRAYAGANQQGHRRRAGREAGTDQEELELAYSNKYDYKRFLKRFAIPREEVELDTESFDYVFYNYGMEHYGNMPLIEPLEYKEVNRLEELVIAIDTSGSCTSEIVQQFLEETYGILSEKENFFHEMNVHIVQCDCCVQDVAVIHSEEEWNRYSKKIKIQGRGGTDFRPVFRYVEEQKEKGEIRKLKALIYFTDGDGVYPQSKPDYEVAFAFLEETPKMEIVPPWALCLLANGKSPMGR
ncbi:MAG: hypothetical protein HFH60_10995 [Lachnospiraceae bacterium]|nr:hypothetical protein [Lachnospiraceae bacterium]MCI9547196.1 hypothetical protein [Lachnospiraceae bacterium]